MTTYQNKKPRRKLSAVPPSYAIELIAWRKADPATRGKVPPHPHSNKTTGSSGGNRPILLPKR